MSRLWRHLDNTAKAFSLGDKKSTNTFRLSVTLKEKVNLKILKKAIDKTLDIYPSYKVRMKSGFFWNYLEFNEKEPIVLNEEKMSAKTFDLSDANNYLFRVTYFNNKINLDMSHILTDGLGAIIFLKGILYNYLNLKYNLETNNDEVLKDVDFNKDEYLNNVNKRLICKKSHKSAFLIREKTLLSNNKTNQYIFDLDKIKKVSKDYDATMSEYLITLYIYALYKTIYDMKSNKDIVVTVPIDLRSYYNVESFSNFFTCMNVEGKVVDSKDISFENLLKQVQKEFKNKLTKDDIPKYLSRDVKLGTNIGINLVPLFLKRMFMKHFSKFIGKSTTSTFSNVGPITVDKKYKKYIDNIVAFANAGKIQKIKCTICSYENKLMITINSNLISNEFEKEFSRLLEKYVGEFKLKSNII